jgi:hypothetical protein
MSDSEPLTTLMAGGPMPLDEVIRIGREVADSLEKTGIHGELWPSAISVSGDRVGVLPPGAADRSKWGQYAAPERVLGKPATAASDVFSLSAILFHALAGRPPFKGDSPTAVMLAACTDVPLDLRQLRSDAPMELVTLLNRALSKDPAARYLHPATRQPEKSMGKSISDEKLRDMIRSILPSKHREVARQAKTHLKRVVRRGVRGDLRHVDFETTEADLFRDANQSYNVMWRRGSDKLNHFMRWCHALTKGMTREDALAYVRRILPDSLIGDHAYSHWEWERGLRYGREWPKFVHRDPARVRQSCIDSTRVRLERILRNDPESLGELNARIKSLKQEGEPRRLLRGIHDIEAFVTEAFDRCGMSVEWRCLNELIEQHDRKGGRKAALQRFTAPYRSGRTVPNLPPTSVTTKRSSYVGSVISGMSPPKALITSRVVFEWPTTSTVSPSCFSRTILAISAAYVSPAVTSTAFSPAFSATGAAVLRVR